MRYAILSDVHGNLLALEAVVSDLEAQGVDKIFYLGDAIGYGPEPDAVIALLHTCVSRMACQIDGHSTEQQVWLSGNHEWGLLGRADREAFNDEALITLDHTHAELSQEAHALLAALPTRIELTLDQQIQTTLVHAAPSEPVGIRHYIRNEVEASEEAKLFPGQICLVGHTHYPRIFRETSRQIGQHRLWDKTDAWEGVYTFADERLIMNPGSVGQPRDGDPRACYAILDTAMHSFTVRRVDYDIPAAQARLHTWLGDTLNNLSAPDGLAGRLERGI